MHGTLIPLAQLVRIPNTRMAVPNPELLVVYGGPILVLAALWWLVNRTDRIINFLFPSLEWEKSLGWLNITAERRAKTAFRWLGYAFYLLLAGLLYAIVRIADAFPPLDEWSNPENLGTLIVEIPALTLCLGIWLLYLGGVLVPKIRAERDEAELKKFRAEMAEREKEREMLRQTHSRVKAPLQKPRTNAPLTSPDSKPARRWDQPGG